MESIKTCLLLTAVLIGAGATTLRINDCMNNGRKNQQNIVHVNTARVSPDPVVIPGDITVNGNGDILKNVNGPLRMKVSVQRIILGIQVTIPCISNFGSCEYPDACQIMSMYKSGNESHCPHPLPENHFPCTCPFTAGTYTLNQAAFKIPEMSGPLSWLTSGTYHAQGQLIDSDGTVVACQSMDIVATSACSGFSCLFG